jgi:glycosyltransferase involved in cell wall biosynthesis
MFLPLAPLIRIFRYKTVYDSYEFYTLDIALRFPESIHSIVEQVLKKAENTLVRTVNCVLSIDSMNDQLLRRYSDACSYVTILYNVPRVEKGRHIERNDNNNESYQLVYVGGISIEKGAVRAINSVSMLQAAGYPVNLHFIGTIQGGELWFWRAVESANVLNSITHTAWLPYESMLERIIGADVALALHQPTERFRRVSTGNGRKFFTYMQAGLPIIGPEFAEVGQAVAKTDCGRLVDTTDTEIISDAISELLDAPNQRTEMGKRGRRAVEEQFNWNIEKRKLITAYRQCVNGR